MNPHFSTSLRPGEFRWGLRYLLFETAFLPTIVSSLNAFFSLGLSLAQLNFLLFCVNFAAIAVIFHRFLRDSIEGALEEPVLFFRAFTLGFSAYWMGNILLSRLITWIDPTFGNVNDGAIGGMLSDFFAPMAFATVVLVPITEECLFRGLLFRGIYHKGRVFAYCVSTLAFCAIHMIPYIGFQDPMTLLLCFLQYIPAGLSFAWAYERSGTIIAPIAIHAAINAIGVAVMR